MKDWVTLYSNRSRPSLAPVGLETHDGETIVLLHPKGARRRTETTEDAYYAEDDSVREGALLRLRTR